MSAAPRATSTVAASSPVTFTFNVETASGSTNPLTRDGICIEFALSIIVGSDAMDELQLMPIICAGAAAREVSPDPHIPEDCNEHVHAADRTGTGDRQCRDIEAHGADQRRARLCRERKD